MVKMFSFFTEEIDDVELALSDIRSQMASEGNRLLSNTIGILHCYHEFITSGVVRALSDKMAFPIIGITVPYVCLPGKSSSMGLMLNVLTSDDVAFVSAVSSPITQENVILSTEKLCDDIKGKLDGRGKPAMIMAFGPFMHVLKINGDDYIDAISACFPNTPVFGSLSFSEEIDFSKCYMLYDGEAYENNAGIIAWVGNVNPSFLTISVPEKNIIGELATVTKSSGNTIHEINGVTVEEYAISMGFIDQPGELNKLYSTPMIAKLKDGSTIVRVCIGGDGHGGAIMGGSVPEGATIGITMLELSDTIATGKEIAENALEILDGRNIMIYSCMARLEFLGANQREMEAKTICDVLAGTGRYFLAYSGGEIFPEQLSGGGYANHLQNYSVVICLV
jgi:hypothetical protein